MNKPRFNLEQAQLANAPSLLLTPKQIDAMCDAALTDFRKQSDYEKLGDFIVGFAGIKDGDNAIMHSFSFTNDKQWRAIKRSLSEVKTSSFGISFAKTFSHYGMQ